jgi:hypothetical protein
MSIQEEEAESPNLRKPKEPIHQAGKTRKQKGKTRKQKYDGSQEPMLWLSDYLQAVQILGGSRAIAMQTLQLHLTGAARSWLSTLPDDSLGS